MRDYSAEPFDPAEARLASRMRQWADHGVVEIDAADIARRAASASRTNRHAWPASALRSGRALLGLAALLLLATGLALAAAATLLRSAPTDTYRAVVTRPVDGGVDVVLVDASGHERVLRHVTVEGLGLDPRYVFQTGGSVNQRGWLQLSVITGDAAERTGAADRTGLARNGFQVLVDLADPARAPVILPGNGFMGGRWGPDGQYALLCGRDCHQAPVLEQQATRKPGMSHEYTEIGFGQVRVLDLDQGISSEIIVPRVDTFGGGPDIFWTADGSGFLARQGSEWGVTPIDGGPFEPGLPMILSREQYATVPGLDEQYATTLGLDVLGQYINEDWHATEPGSTTPVAVQRSADWAAVWQLLVDTQQTSSRAVLARRAGPGAVDSVHTFDVPEDLGWAIRPVDGQEGSFVIPWFTLAPDDAFVALHGANENLDRFVLAPLTPGDQNAAAGPVIEGWLAGLVPAPTADSWPGR